MNALLYVMTNDYNHIGEIAILAQRNKFWSCDIWVLLNRTNILKNYAAKF